MKPFAQRRLLLSKIAWRTLVALAALYLVLLIPERKLPAPVGAGRRPFSWNRDAFWSSLERQFREDRVTGCEALAARIDAVGEPVRDALTTTVSRMFRLDENLFDFYKLVKEDGELSWCAVGAGRMLRAPTVFEDVVKTT